MTPWIYPEKYFSISNDNRGNRDLILKNLFFIILSMFFITCILFQLLPEMNAANLLTTFVFLSLICIPFYLIFNFFISLLYLVVLVFFHPTVKISDFYSIVLTYNSLIFLFNTFSINLIFLYSNSTLIISVLLLSIIVNLWGIRILTTGLVSYAGFSQKTSFVFCAALFLLNTVLLVGGNLINV